MRVLVYSEFAPLAGHLVGGAQRYANGLLTALGDTGVHMTYVCPPADRHPLLDSGGRLELIDRLRAVVPLDHAESVSPVEVHHDLHLLSRLAADADVVVTIDTQFPLQTEVPIVLWLNNFSYPPETRSVFGLNWNVVVVPSEYVLRCLRWYLPDASWMGDPPPVRVIAPGLDITSDLDGQDTEQIRAALGLPRGERYLTFPHRADPDKGFATALHALGEVRRRGHSHRLLVPTLSHDDLWPHQAMHVRERELLVEQLGLDGAVVFHDWIPAEHMAAYMRCAEWSLCPSELPESFGLSVVESVAAGVPVVATPAGAVPEIMPRGHGVEIVEFKDWEAIADRVERGIPDDELERGAAFVRREFAWERCAAQWLDVLVSARKTSARYVPVPAPHPDPPWIRTMLSGRRWDDYSKSFIPTGDEAAVRVPIGAGGGR
jgi:glycosyltransferase involved in cell wall biosynthesis